MVGQTLQQHHLPDSSNYLSGEYRLNINLRSRCWALSVPGLPEHLWLVPPEPKLEAARAEKLWVQQEKPLVQPFLGLHGSDVIIDVCQDVQGTHQALHPPYRALGRHVCIPAF